MSPNSTVSTSAKATHSKTAPRRGEAEEVDMPVAPNKPITRALIRRWPSSGSASSGPFSGCNSSPTPIGSSQRAGPPAQRTTRRRRRRHSVCSLPSTPITPTRGGRSSELGSESVQIVPRLSRDVNVAAPIHERDRLPHRSGPAHHPRGSGRSSSEAAWLCASNTESAASRSDTCCTRARSRSTLNASPLVNWFSAISSPLA